MPSLTTATSISGSSRHRFRPFLIVYDDLTVFHGENQDDWHEAPSDGVQVVAELRPVHGARRTYKADGVNHPVKDRRLYDGMDEYDPFGWGPKQGSKITDEKFERAWHLACTS